MEEAVIKRIMPHNTEAEQSVLGAMFMSRDAIMVATDILTGEDFYQQQYGAMFTAMAELYAEGQPVDLVTLQNRLRENGVPEELCSVEYISELVNAVPTSANVKYYANIVSDKATLRRMIRLNEEIANTCYMDQESVSDILATTEQKMFQLLQRGNKGEFTPIREIVMNALDSIDAASKSSNHITGLSSGYRDLDRRTAGFHPSDFILVAARPSMGKTAFVLNIANHMALHDDKYVCIFSLEMSKEQLVNRLFACDGHIDAQNIRTGNLSDTEWAQLVYTADKIGGSKLIIDDTPGISVSEMRSKCRKLKLEKRLDCVMIDYLQKMEADRHSDSKQQEISEISQALKTLARELEIPVIALSQLSRAVEKRYDKRPMLSDLRESGAIEQDADVVMFIYRDAYYNRDADNELKNIAEINIAKQRNGPTGTVNLVWIPEYTKFADPVSEDQIPEYERE